MMHMDPEVHLQRSADCNVSFGVPSRENRTSAADFTNA